MDVLRLISLIPSFAQDQAAATPPAADAASTPPDDRTLIEAATDLLAKHWPNNAEEWEKALVQFGKSILLPALGVVVALLVALFLAKSIRRSAERTLVKAKVELTLARFLSKVASWSFLGLVLLTILSTVGVNITSLAAILGATGLAVGLAIQGALTNLSAGVMLLIFRPYRLGDVVRLDGELGTVADIELFTTRLDTLDNRRIILPNNKIYGSKIENLTRNPQRRVDIPVGISYTADFDETKDALTSAIAQVPLILKEPAPAAVAVGFGDSAVNWEVRIWCTPSDVVQVRSELIRHIMAALSSRGIDIPFPQRHLHLAGPIQLAPAEST